MTFVQTQIYNFVHRTGRNPYTYCIMYLLNINQIKTESTVLDEAVREILQAAQDANADWSVEDTAHNRKLMRLVVQELIVFATYASTIPPTPPRLFLKFVTGFPFSAILQFSMSPFTAFSIAYFKENSWRFRADSFAFPVVGEEEMQRRYDYLSMYIEDFLAFLR